jgi:septation ring formation regulator EzrA
MDGYCFDGISSKFKLYSTLADQLQQVFTTMNQEITRILNANRNDLNKTLKDFLTPIQTSLDEMKLILGAIHQKIPDIYPVINSATQAGLDISELRNVVVTNLREIQDSMGILGKELCERADRNDLHHQFNDIGDILRNVEKELKSIGLTLSMKNNSD